jgi:hypothetical protein
VLPRLGTELGEGFVLGNRHVGMTMHLLVPRQVLHSITECLMFASRLWCLLLLLLLSLPSLLLLLLLSYRGTKRPLVFWLDGAKNVAPLFLREVNIKGVSKLKIAGFFGSQREDNMLQSIPTDILLG